MTTTTVSQPVSTQDERTYKFRWIALLILSMSLMLIVIDSTIVNIAFPSIRATFGASFADAEWINSIYSLVFGAALITWGKLGDQYGRRNIFIAGAALFGLSSVGVGFAPSIGAAVAMRALQGMGGAMMSPSTLSIVSATFKGKERGIAFGIWGATAGVSAAIGPMLGGWLIDYGTGVMAESWRLAFLINVPVVVVAIIGAMWAIRESRDPSAKTQIDWIGILIATIGLGSFVFGAIEGQNYGWLEAKKVFELGPLSYPALPAGAAIPPGTPSFIPVAFAIGLLMLVVFILYETRREKAGKEVLFEFGLLRYRSFAFGLMTIFVVALGEFGTFLVLSIYYQLAKGLGAFDTGVQFLSFAAVTIIAAPLAGVLSSRFGAKWIVTLGMIFEAIALFWTGQILHADIELSQLMPPLMFYGAGIGLAIAQLANIVLSDVPPQKAGVASGATNTVRQLGAALGIAIIGAILFGTFADAATPLVRESTAFEDFGARVAANDNLSNASRVIGTQIANFGGQVKEAIIDGLQANEGFDSNNQNPLDMAIANIPPVAKTALRLQGINLDDADTVAQLHSELDPDLEILQADILYPLAEGFSTAGRAAATMAGIFVTGGALCSLLLPNRTNKPQDGAVMAH